MTQRFIITATGTDIGKTLIAAVLMLGLKASYWKPVQCGTGGTEGETDTQTLRRVTELPGERFFPESCVFRNALSPHRAAELEGREIDPEKITMPACDAPLLIEGAGGLLVPLTRKFLLVDLFAKWQIPVLLCASTALGTINHTLLSVEALKARKIPLRGLIFTGPENPDNIRTICEFSGARALGCLPPLEAPSPARLSTAFDTYFNAADFA